ncbi:MAG: hypothetical protein ACRCR7_05250 [Weissella cibaria]
MRILVRLAVIGLLLFGTFLFSYEAEKPVTTKKTTTTVPKSTQSHRTPLTTKQLHDNQLLYFAAIINYATSNITDGRWQEVKHPSNGWQFEPHLVSGTTRYFVWPDKQATADQKMVMPNWFSVSDNVVTLHSFIIHSGGQDVVHEISVQEIIHWHNQSQVRLQRLEKIQANSRLLTEMTKKTSSTNR